MIFKPQEATTENRTERAALCLLTPRGLYSITDATGVRIPVEFNLHSLVLVSLAHPDHKLLADHRDHENRC